MSTREEIDHWFGHPDYAGETTMPIAPKLDACPACGAQLNPTRPTHTCPDCGAQLKGGFMSTMTNVKRAKLGKMRAEAINRILSTLSGPELLDPSPEYPLGGTVHLAGIGWVTVQQLRDELARRVTA